MLAPHDRFRPKRATSIVALLLAGTALASCKARSAEPAPTASSDPAPKSREELRAAAREARRSERPAEERWKLAEAHLRASLALADDCPTRADLTSLYLERSLVAPVAGEEPLLRESIERCTRDLERGQWWARIAELREAAGDPAGAGAAACQAVVHGQALSARTCIRLGSDGAERWTIALAGSMVASGSDRAREAALLEEVVAARPDHAIAWERLARAAHAASSPRACPAFDELAALTTPSGGDFERGRLAELSRELGCR